jgi:hypothetical protein
MQPQADWLITGPIPTNTHNICVYARDSREACTGFAQMQYLGVGAANLV